LSVEEYRVAAPATVKELLWEDIKVGSLVAWGQPLLGQDCEVFEIDLSVGVEVCNVVGGPACPEPVVGKGL